MDMPMGSGTAVSESEEVRPASKRETKQVLVRQDLIRSILAAASVVERRNTIPVLGTVLIQPRGDRMTVRGTNLDQEVTVDFGPAPKRGGLHAAIQSPRAVAGLLKGLTGDHLSVRHDDGKVLVEDENFTAALSTLHADDFPSITTGTEGWAVDLPRSIVDTLLRVSGAMSTEETRYYLNGVHIRRFPDSFTYRIAATDGHRLYFADVELPDAGVSFPEGGVIIPRAAVALVAKLRNRKGDEPARLKLMAPASDNSVADWTSRGATTAAFQFGAISMVTKTIDGTFPDIGRVIPTAEPKHSFLANVADLRRAIRALSHGLDVNKSRAIRLVISGNKLQIGAKFVVSGFDADFTIDAQTTGALEIWFNGYYLLSVLDAVGGDEVFFAFTDEFAPAKIIDPAGTGISAILMPMRL